MKTLVGIHPWEQHPDIQHDVVSVAMSMDQHDKDIRSYGPCVRLYHWHGSGDGHFAHRLGRYGLFHRKLLIQAGGRHDKAFTILSWKIGRDG